MGPLLCTPATAQGFSARATGFLCLSELLVSSCHQNLYELQCRRHIGAWQDVEGGLPPGGEHAATLCIAPAGPAHPESRQELELPQVGPQNGTHSYTPTGSSIPGLENDSIKVPQSLRAPASKSILESLVKVAVLQLYLRAGMQCCVCIY